MSNKRRVVVTGLGALTPIGLTTAEFWTNLLAGKSGAGPVTYFDTALYDTHFACELKGFKATDYMDRKSAQRSDPFAQYATVSSDMAVADAGLSSKETDPDRIGVVYGSGIGGMMTYDTQFQNYMGGDRGGSARSSSPC
jgi:3-oxoacyl-[acyl-carrier-protein] synthase II